MSRQRVRRVESSFRTHGRGRRWERRHVEEVRLGLGQRMTAHQMMNRHQRRADIRELRALERHLDRAMGVTQQMVADRELERAEEHLFGEAEAETQGQAVAS